MMQLKKPGEKEEEKYKTVQQITERNEEKKRVNTQPQHTHKAQNNT